jgi:uncharacterized protein (DUF58 family)
MAVAPLWRPDVVARVRALQLRARQTVAGLGVGPRRSIRVGQAVEFADYKPYAPGDNLRDLDWRVLGRRDRLVVRRYRAETEMGVTLVLDASADLGSTPEKWEQAVAFLATVAWLCFLENEPIALRIVAGEGVPVRALPPRRGRGHVARVFTLLAAVRPAGRAGLAEAFTEVGARAHARGLVVLVSDFMEPVEGWARALDALVRRRADVRAIQVYDDRETSLGFSRPIRLYSPEGGADEPLDPEAMREEVAAEARRFFAEVAREVHKRRGLARLLEARGSLVEAVGAFLRGRQAA